MPRWIAEATTIGIACTAFVISGCDEPVGHVHDDRERMIVALTDLRHFVHQYIQAGNPGDRFCLIEGDVAALETCIVTMPRRFSSEELEWFALLFRHANRLLSTKNGRVAMTLDDFWKTNRSDLELRDSWGHRLVYRCPASDSQFIFHLYSVGPNGVDEGGKGDDIEVSAQYSRIGHLFTIENFDGDDYANYRDVLKWRGEHVVVGDCDVGHEE